MFKINFYKDAAGRQPVKEYLDSLQKAADTSKDSRIKLKKIVEYIDILSQNGTRAGIPYVKHIDGDLWELRPLRDRIFFFCWQGDHFILLHHFLKKSQKTPKREIEQAKRNLKDFIERSTHHEK